VLAFHLLASTITGYGGKVAPPFSRTFIGGENDVRGFDFYSISPIGFIPSSASIAQLNPDGTQRTQKVLVNGVLTPQPVSLAVPTYQIITPGGDTHAVFNFEYRIPIVGPITLVPFFDAGMNRILYTNQLTVNPGQIANLDAQFPQAAYSNKVKLAPGTQATRISTGLELDVVLPIVQAPFRIYWAYNPTIVRQNLQPPVVVDRSMFPNNATFLQAIQNYGQAYPLFEKHSTFRFTIGKTF
jgi:outer membrane protein insertion porin family